MSSFINQSYLTTKKMHLAIFIHAGNKYFHFLKNYLGKFLSRWDSQTVRW